MDIKQVSTRTRCIFQRVLCHQSERGQKTENQVKIGKTVVKFVCYQNNIVKGKTKLLLEQKKKIRKDQGGIRKRNSICMPMGSEEWQSFDFQQQSLSHHIAQGENSKHLLKIKRLYKPHLIKFSFTAFVYLPKQCYHFHFLFQLINIFKTNTCIQTCPASLP